MLNSHRIGLPSAIIIFIGGVRYGSIISCSTRTKRRLNWHLGCGAVGWATAATDGVTKTFTRGSCGCCTVAANTEVIAGTFTLPVMVDGARLLRSHSSARERSALDLSHNNITFMSYQVHNL